MDLFRLGSRLARQYGRSRRARTPARAPAAPAPSPADHSYGPGGAYQPAPDVGQLAGLIQALQQREIPALPGHAPAPAAPAAAPQTDALALLRLIVSNPQFQQSLQQAATSGPAAPRTVPLPVPVGDPGGATRPVPIPLGAVMNAIVTLAGQSMTELNAMSREDDPEVPEYLVSEDGEFIVDPASPEERAALVTHWFRVSDQTRQGAAEPRNPSPENELDESDDWARAAGFMR